MYREDMRQFFTGIGRFIMVVRETFQLLNLLRQSDAWIYEFRRLWEIEPVSFGSRAFLTYNNVMELYKDDDFEAAGQQLALGLFPKKMLKH